MDLRAAVWAGGFHAPAPNPLSMAVLVLPARTEYIYKMSFGERGSGGWGKGRRVRWRVIWDMGRWWCV